MKSDDELIWDRKSKLKVVIIKRHPILIRFDLEYN